MRTYSGKPGRGVSPDKDYKELLFIRNKQYKEVEPDLEPIEVLSSEEVEKLEERNVLHEGENYMALNKKQMVVIKRGLRALGAVVISAVLTWLAGPEAADLVSGFEQQALVLAVLTSLLQMVDKALRYGSEPGENPAATVFTLNNPKNRDAVDGPDEGDRGHE